MTATDIKAGRLTARISTRGGSLLGLWWEKDGLRVPLLREASSDEAEASSSGCYPLVPFGSGVRMNRFSFQGRDHVLQPHAGGTGPYLDGEGWLSEWTILTESRNEVELGFSHRGDGTPYAYEATQHFAIHGDRFEMHLLIRNLGDVPLPFGLGWHPFFPMTALTTLKAAAKRFWSEAEDRLPGVAGPVPEELDFSIPRTLPHYRINNGFEGWDGIAEVTWPEHGLRLRLTADRLFRHVFVCVPDGNSGSGHERDHFCFAPMSHLANGHHLPGLGDLAVLKPGAILAGGIRLRPEAITSIEGRYGPIS